MERSLPVAKLSSRFTITIRRSIRRKLKLRAGQRVVVSEGDGVITVVPDVPIEKLRGIARGVTLEGIREKPSG